jgi:S1-C subfamily serine protease
MRLFKLVALLAGIAVLTAEAQAFIALPSLTGAQVTAVWPNSPAQRVGLEPGDIIVAIDGQPVRTLTEFNRLVEMSGRRVNLLVRNVRNGQYVYAEAFPYNGRIGVQLRMVVLPEATLRDVWRR